MKNLFLLLCLFFTARASFGCTYPSYYLAEPNWVMEEPFVLECLSKEPILDQPKMDKLKSELNKTFPNIFINVSTLSIKVDVQERKNEAKAPIVMLKTGGHGLIGTIARFEGRIPTIEDFKAIAVTPTKDKIIKELTKKKLVVLVLEGSDDFMNKKFNACAERGAKMALDMAKKKCTVMKCRLDDPAEKYFIKNIFIGTRKERAGILILFGKGKGLYFIDNTDNCQVVMEMAQQLDHETNAEAQALEARIFLNMALPK